MMHILRNLFIPLVFLFINFTADAQKSEVRGRVSDSRNNEPIAFANIIVEGTQTGGISDLDGNFRIMGLEAGYINLLVTYVGYKPKRSQDILLSNTNVPFIEMMMDPLEQTLSEIVVSVDPFEKKQEAPLSMQNIGIKEIESNPGSNRDISRVIQSFPGVGSTPAFRNDVIIRGGDPAENRFYLDDVEIPVLNHFSTQGASGGPVGIINADFIRSVDFYSGSFPADKYNALSGILDFRQKEGSKDKAHLQAALGASETALTVDGPIGDKTTYIFSVRRSYLQFLFSAIGLPFLPTFNDYQLKLKTNFDRKNQLTIISIGSLDHLALNTEIKNPDESQEYILSQIPVNNQWSYTVGGVYKHFFDKGFHTLVLSRNSLNNAFYKYPDNDESRARSFDYQSTETENKLRYEFSLRSKGIKYDMGVNMEYARYDNSTSQLIYLSDSLIDFKYNTQFNMLKYGFSAQASKRIFKSRLLTSFGFRMDGNNYNARMSNILHQFSPRFSLSYALTDRLLLNAGLGRYFQQAAYTTLGYRNNQGILANDEVSEYIGVNHYNLGIEQKFNDKVLLSVEGFYKDYFQYPIDLITGASLANQGAAYSGIAGASPVNFEGSGSAIGFEILNRINLKNFTLLASYTFVRSRFTDIHGTLIPSSWDSKHLLTITGSRNLKRHWQLGFKWRYVGGLPYTPYDLNTSTNIEAWDAQGWPYFDNALLNSERFGAFHQLDLRIDKNFFFDHWALMLYLDIQNAYNFKNTGQDYIVREKDAAGKYMTTTDGQHYILKSISNQSGTVLPTIGIIVKL